MKVRSAADAETLLNYAISLCEAAGAVGITLRLFGSCAVRIQCEHHSEILNSARRYPKDIDAVGSRRDRTRLREFLKDRGWNENIGFTARTDGYQLKFTHSRSDTRLDVSIDELRFAQTLPLHGRLDLNRLTITPVDLLLSKLQIFDLTDHDIIDILSLVHAAPPEYGTALTIDLKRIAEVVSASWRWYHAVRLSLDRVKKAAASSPAFASEPDRQIVLARLEKIAETIVSVPKTVLWRIRAVFAELLPWHNSVEMDEI